MNNIEFFHPINGFDGYEITDQGRVWSRKSKQFLSISSGYNYVRACLSLDGKPYQRPVCNLVAEHFLNDWNKDLKVEHIDCNVNNNFASNLRMALPSVNKK